MTNPTTPKTDRFYPISEPSITELEVAYVLDAVKSGWVSSLGKYLDVFEQKFAAYCGTEFALTTSNGTTALHLALVALGVQPGDEVIVPDLTFIATANAVAYIGAKPVLVDIEPDTLCLDPAKLEAAITERTKAVIPVHLYGHPANMPEIMRIAKARGLHVVEDAAEAHGATIAGARVGSLGDCGVFSFYGNKIITTGEGGMITTSDQAFYLRAKQLRDHAMSKDKRYWHDEIGYNYRMTNLQAALGVAQFERIDALIERRREIFAAYQEGLRGLPVRLNATAPWAQNVYWLICAEFPEFTADQRDDLMRRLKERGVDSRPYFYPISDMPMYRQDPALTPEAHAASARGLCLPTYSNLTDQDVATICSILRSVL